MPKSSAYERVARDLRERILHGSYAPGTRMPSLHDVQAEFRVSQAIARSAYQMLINEGLVEGRFGGGYYVRSYRPIIRHAIQRLAADQHETGITIWDADPGTAGRQLVVDGLSVATEVPPADVAADLGLDDAATAVVRRRRYVLDGRPVLLSTSYFPADLAVGTAIENDDTGPGGAYARLTDAGQPPTWFQEDVAARMPTPHETHQLKLPTISPVIVIRRLVWGPTDRQLELNAMVGDAGSYILRYRWPADRPQPPAPTNPTTPPAC